MFSPEFLHYPGSHELPRDFMALFHESIMAERDGEKREMERRKRQAQMERKQQAEKMEAAEPNFGPIFSAPVRAQNVDDITMRVYNTLGEFSNVRNNLVDSSTQRHLLGIPKLPMTPVDNKTQARFPNAAGLNGKVPNLPPNEMQAWRNAAAAAGQSKPSPAGTTTSNRPSNSTSAGQKTDGNKSNNNSPFTTKNASHTGSKQGGNEKLNTKASDRTKQGNRGQSKSRTTKSSAADAKSSESHSGPPNGATYTKIKKEFGPSQQQRHDAKKSDSRRTGHDTADSRTEHDGSQKKPDTSDSKPGRSIFDDDDDYEKPVKQERPNRPKLDIPKIMEPNNQEKVESILSFMTDIKSPVTAIQTPIKGDASSFPFSLVDKVKGQSGLAAIPEVKPITPLDSRNIITGKTLTDVNNSQASGNESEDSENEDVNKERKEQTESMTTTTTIIGKTTSNANEGEPEGEASGNTLNMDSRVSDSSSESSSSESEGSGSEESETESEESAQESEEDEQPVQQPAKPKFGLLNVIEKVKTQAKSPATLGGKPQFGSSAPGNSPLSSRTPSNGDSFPSKLANDKLGTKHGEKGTGFGMDISLPSSKYSGNFDKYSDSNENDMADFNKLSKESKIERTSLKKPTAKAKGPKKVPVKNNPLKSTSAKGGSPQVKGDTKKEKTTKTKFSRQSNKTSNSNGPVEGKQPKNSAKSTPKSDKKSKMPSDGRGRGKKRLPSPISREFVYEDSSDSEAESVSKSLTKSPCKVNGTSATDSITHSLSPKSSACSKSNVSKGKNKTKLERNCVYSVSSLDDVFTSISPCDEPLLSPLKSPDLMSEITYKAGIPSLIVRFDLSDISNLPSKDDGRTYSRTSCSPSKRDVVDVLDERLPPLVKSKRKTHEMEPENLTSRGESNKKPKNESSSKSPRIIHKEEPQHNESLIPESDTVLDRRRPYERRSSVTSISSHHSSSGRSSKSDKSDHPPNKRRKREHAAADVSASEQTNLENHKHQSVDWMHNEERTDHTRDSSTEVLNDTGCHRNGHKISADEWGADVEGAFTPHMRRFLPDTSSRHRPNVADERQLTADDYLNEGKKLKRLADAQADKNVKALTYFDAVLSFILCGHTMENDPHIQGEKAVTMYNETCEIIKFILKFKGTHQDATYNTDKKLAVLCHRCQALLYTRMFKLKKATAMKMSRALGEHFKSQNKCQQGAQAPSPWNSTKYTGTPSPMSPTPSPAGSVGSVGSMGSQGSNNCDLSSSQNFSSQNKLTNGVAAGAMSSPAAITLPKRIMDMMSSFLVFSNYSLFGLDFWEQSETMAQEHPEFFQELDQQCGPLTLHSSTLDLVRYARNGLHRLKKS